MSQMLQLCLQDQHLKTADEPDNNFLVTDKLSTTGTEARCEVAESCCKEKRNRARRRPKYKLG